MIVFVLLLGTKTLILSPTASDLVNQNTCMQSPFELTFDADMGFWEIVTILELGSWS